MEWHTVGLNPELPPERTAREAVFLCLELYGMSESAVDHEARLRLDRVESNQRDVTRDLVDIQRQMAVSTEIQRGLLQSISDLRARMTDDEIATRALEQSSAVARSRWVLLGAGVLFILNVIGGVVAYYVTKAMQ